MDKPYIYFTLNNNIRPITYETYENINIKGKPGKVK